MLKKLIILAICGVFSHSALAAKSKSKADSKSTTKAQATSQVKDPLSFGFVTENYVSGADLEIGDSARTSSDNHLAIKYQISPDTRVWARQYFHFDYYTNESLEIGDMVFGYNMKHEALNGGWKPSTQMRLYLPLREYNQRIGQIQYRFYGRLSKPISKRWSFAVETNPRLWAYTKYQDGQRALKWKNHMVLTFDAFEKLSISSYLGHAHYNYNTGQKFDPDKDPVDWESPYGNDDGAYFDLEFVSPVSDNITLIGLISQEYDLRSSESFQMFNPNETTYFIIGAISL
tara:strand:- start:46914 stop:47777 length:864 start_codon:yes stop_codon:yes gene_type:complete